MLKWKGFNKSFLIEHRWVLSLWLFFIMFSMAYVMLTPYGELNILVSKHYKSSIGYFFRYYTHFGEEWLLVPIGLALIFIIKKRDFTIKLIAAFVINSLITIPVKYCLFSYDRPRVALEKFNLIFTEGVDVHQFNSFPSGHSSAAFSMALMVALWYKDRLISFIVILMAIGVGMSRIYLQQHFIEDVMGGAIIGLLAASLSSGFYWQPKIK